MEMGCNNDGCRENGHGHSIPSRKNNKLLTAIREIWLPSDTTVTIQ
jgi:hypothetical protein